MGIRFELTPESEARFGRLLARMAARSNKSANELMFQMTKEYLLAARKLTPISQRKREKEVLKRAPPFRKNKDGRGSAYLKWAVTHYEHDEKKRWLFWSDEEDKMKAALEIKNRGAARGAWSGMLGKVYGSKEDQGLKLDKPGGYVIQAGQEAAKKTNIIVYLLGYILKHVSNIQSAALMSSRNRIINGYMARMPEELKREWEAA